MQEATAEQIAEIHEVGDIIAQSVYDFLSSEEGQGIVADFEELGIDMTAPLLDLDDAKFTDKTFVVTGTLSKYSRDEIQGRIKELGGRASSSISKKTDYLVAGENAGSKLAKSQQLGITILTEDEFDELANGE